jgi:hypothetical protein
MKFSFLSIISMILLFSCTKEIIQHKLSVSVTPINGGSVSPPSNSYEKGQSLQMLATPAGEYVFKEWKGDLSGSINPSTLIIDKDKAITGSFEKRQYPLTLTIDGSGTVKEEIIAVATQALYPSGTTVRLTPQPLEGWAFSGWSGDLTSAANPLDLKIEKAINLKATFSKLNITSIKIDNQLDTLIISQKHKYKVLGIYSNGTSVDISNQVKLTATTNISILDDLGIVGAKSGSGSIKVSFNNLVIEDAVYVNYYEEVLSKVTSYLRESNSNTEINIPVVIINYHPTNDGFSIDMRRYLDDFYIRDHYYSFYGLDRNLCANGQKNNPICQTGTLEMYKVRAQDIHSLTKFAIEEGSKFRNYDNPNSMKNNNVKIVKYFNFYEIKTKIYEKYSKDIPQPDYQDLFAKINLEKLVNDFGVKEVWFSMPPLSTEYPSIQQGLISKEYLLNMPESNMSSPFGDISNSAREETDLPKYKNTYVVYGVNIDRGPGEAVHNRGHQIESQLSFIEKDKKWPNELFWNKFVGMRPNGGPLGRVGSTHFPPNSNVDYDWGNKNLIESDIKDWKPEGGTLSKVNVDTWLSKTYNFPSNIFWGANDIDNLKYDNQYKWLIYWFQSFPNKNNNISYKTNSGKQTTLSNWWDLFYNWDDAIKSKKTLWVE